MSFPLNLEDSRELLAFTGLVVQAGILIAKVYQLGLSSSAPLLELDDGQLKVGSWGGGIDVVGGL